MLHNVPNYRLTCLDVLHFLLPVGCVGCLGLIPLPVLALDCLPVTTLDVRVLHMDLCYLRVDCFPSHLRRYLIELVTNDPVQEESTPARQRSKDGAVQLDNIAS